MAPRETSFLDATHLLGAGWQCTPLAQTQRGEWFITIRHGSHGLESSFHGCSGGDVLAQAGRHVLAVNSSFDAAMAQQQRQRLRARPVQQFDTSALPLFGDSRQQLDLVDLLR